MADRYNEDIIGSPYVGENEDYSEQLPDKPLTPQELEEMSRQEEIERLMKIQNDAKVLKEAQKAEKADLQNQKNEFGNQKLKDEINQKELEKLDDKTKHKNFAKGLDFLAKTVNERDNPKVENIEAKGFDPEGNGYDYETAKKHGLGQDETGHYPSRVPETGQLLKGKNHPTFSKTVDGEMKAGYEIKKGEDGKYYSQKKVVPKDLQADTTGLPMDKSNIETPIRDPFRKPQEKQLNNIVKTREDGVKTDLVDAPPTDNLPRKEVDLSHQAIRDAMSPKELLMDDYRQLKERQASDRSRGKWADLGKDMGQALAQYGSDMGAVKAGMIGATTITPKQLKFDKSSISDRIAKEQAMERAEMQKQMDKLDKLEADSLARNDKNELNKIKMAKFLLDEKYKNKQMSKMDADIAKLEKEGMADPEHNDPNSMESMKLQDMEIASLRSQGIKFNEEDIRKLSAKYLSDKSYIAGKRKVTTLLQAKRHDDKMNHIPREKATSKVNDAIAVIGGSKGVRSLMPMDLRRLRLAEDAQRVLELVKNKKVKSSASVAMELGKLLDSTLSGTGQGTSGGAEEFVPGSVYGKLQKMREYLLASPQDTLSDDHLKQFSEQIHGQVDFYLNAVNKDIRAGTYGIKPYLDRFPELKENYRNAIKIATKSLKEFEKSGGFKTPTIKDSYKKVAKEPELKPAPYKAKHNKDDLLPKNGKTYKWNATKGKYQLYR